MAEKFESSRESKEIESIQLTRATLENADDILTVEKSIGETKLYSSLTNRQEVIEEIANSVFYLIQQENKIVGDVSYQMKDKNHAYISGLAVIPEFQTKGIGKEAIKMILEELKDMDLIDLVTHPKNERAIKLYADFGFKEVGPKLENYFGDGEPRIRMVLEKEHKKT